MEPKDQPLHPIELYQCQDCGLAQLLYEITPEEIYSDYLYLTSSSPGLWEHFLDYALQAQRVCSLQKGDLVVDIGSNDGMLLRAFRRHGMRVLGIEPSQGIADIAEREGVPTMCRYFGKNLGIGKAKLITANNVVANMNDLDAFMEGVLDLLEPDGTLIFESFYLGDVVKNMVFDFIYHEHLSAFSVRPIKRLMARYGMRLYRVEHMPTKGGSIRYYCCRYYAKRDAEEIPDDDPALYERQTYADFAARISVEKIKTLAFLETAKAAGKTFAGFGASISCTTLMYHFGLAPFIDYLVDDNPAKIGRYSPGHHLKVYSPHDIYSLKPAPSRAYERKPDAVIALAWRFAKTFKRKYPDMPLIVPLPRFQADRNI